MSSVSPSQSASGVPQAGAVRAADHRIEATLAWAGCLAAIVAGFAGAWYTALDQATGHPVIQQSPVSGLAGAAIATAYGTVGLLLVLRRPHFVIAWLFLLIGVVGGMSNYIWGYVGLGLTTGSAPGPIPVVGYAWLNNVLTYPIWVALALLLILLFPDGRPIDRRWRRVVIAAIAVCAVLGVCLAIEPGQMRLFPLDNPLPAPETAGPIVGLVIPVALVGVCVVGALAMWSLNVRYRLADPTERRQLKWFAWGSVLTLVGGAVLVVGALAVTEPGSRLIDLSWVIFAVASTTLPIAAVIAILRDRLYDIDLLINRTFVFGFLTAILAGLYSALIRLFNAVFVGMTGESNEFALVLTTLILATTFTPIKKRLEEIAERRLTPARAGAAETATAAAAPLDPPAPATLDLDELDRRMEAIARRVSLEVVAATRADATTQVAGGRDATGRERPTRGRDAAAHQRPRRALARPVVSWPRPPGPSGSRRWS